MKKILLSVALITTSFTAFTQVGIGTTSPNANAALEITSANKGLLMPRVALTGTAIAAPLSAHIAGMTVYNSATAGDVIPGYYYNDGTVWIRLATDGGNSGSGSIDVDCSQNGFQGAAYLDGATLQNNNDFTLTITNNALFTASFTLSINDLVISGTGEGTVYVQAVNPSSVSIVSGTS